MTTITDLTPTYLDKGTNRHFFKATPDNCKTIKGTVHGASGTTHAVVGWENQDPRFEID